jgi:RNA polymerase sigma factor (sigma-70 family)
MTAADADGRAVDQDGQRIVDLVGAAVGGDGDAWNELVLRYAPLIVSILARYRIFGADAEDISQIVWLRMLEHLHELREPRALPRYLVTTTSNEANRWLRGMRRTRPFDPLEQDTEQPNQADPDEPLLVAERRTALLAALAELPTRQRRVLLLLLEDPPVSYQEISTRLDIPVGSIGPTRKRALLELRESPAIAALIENSTTEGQGGDRRDAAAMGSR